MQRLLSRLKTAVLATLKVSWQLGVEALQGLRQSAVKTKQQAHEVFATRWGLWGWWGLEVIVGTGGDCGDLKWGDGG